MKSRFSIYFLSLLTVFLLMVSCTPQPTSQTSSPTTTANPLPEAIKAPSTPIISPEEAAWQKVVAAAQKEGKLTYYNWGFTGDKGLALAKAFTDRHGIVVELIAGRGAEFIERLKTEARMGQRTADAIESAPSHLENMTQAGLTASVSDLPAIKQKGSFYVDPLIFSPDGKYFAYNRYFNSVVVNTDLVKADEMPQSWLDLLHPRWKGRMLLGDPVLAEVSTRFAVLLKRNLLKQDFLGELGKQDIKFYASTPMVATALVRKDGALVAIGGAVDYNIYAKEGAPLKMLDMKEGVIGQSLVMGAVKDSPHPNATRVFLNWTLTEEGQAVIAQAWAGAPVRKGVTDFTPGPIRLEPKNPVYSNNEDIELMAKVFRDKTYVSLLKPK